MGEIRNFIGAYPLHSLAFGLVAAWELTKITQGVQSNMLGGLGMTTSTSMSTSSSHIPGLMASSAGETSMHIEPNALYGVPNTVRRRVLYGDMPNTPADNIAKENALITANSAKQRKEHSDIVSMQGVFAPVGGYGWI